MNESAERSSQDTQEAGNAQFGPHRFYAGPGGGGTRFRGASFDVADMRGARFVDCDLSGVTIRDGWLVDVDISGYVDNLRINGIDVTDFVNAELDRRHPERVQLRQGESLEDLKRIWNTIRRLWAATMERASALSTAQLNERVNFEWSFSETLRHLIFITDAWAARTVLDQPMPYHAIGLPQSWYPPTDAAGLGIDLSANPAWEEILDVRAERLATMGAIVEGLTEQDLGRSCSRSPAPGYPEENRSVLDCIAVVMEEEIEHHRFATRDLSLLEARRA